MGHECYHWRMHRFILLASLLAVGTACPADSEPSDTTLGIDECGTGDCCQINVNFCETTGGNTLEPADTASSSSVTDASTSSGSSTDDDTGAVVEPPCGFADTLQMLATGKTDPTDCGTVTLDDDATAWEAASECAATAAAGQEAFFVAFQLPSDDSLVFDGYYGTVGIVYGLGQLYTDTFGDPMLGNNSCGDVTTLDGCEIDVGRHCLACVDPGDVAPLECAMR